MHRLSRSSNLHDDLEATVGSAERALDPRQGTRQRNEPRGRHEHQGMHFLPQVAIQIDEGVKWTDVVTAIATVAGAIGTLITLVFFGLQLRSQSAALRDQRDSSSRSLTAVSEQIAAQTEQTRYVAEQTRLQTEQSKHIAEQTQLLAQQYKVVAMTNKSILYQNVTKEMQQLSRIFLDTPNLRCFFYEGATLPPNSPLREQVKILSEMFVDFMGFTLNTDSLFDADERLSWTRYFQYIALNSPCLREYWRSHRHWHEKPVREVLDPIVGTTRDAWPDDGYNAVTPMTSANDLSE